MTVRPTSNGLLRGMDFHVPEILVLLAFYGLEICRASISGDPLPVGVLYFLPGGLLVIAVYTLINVLVNRTPRGRTGLLSGLVSLLAIVMVVTKLLPVGPSPTTFLTGLYLAGPFVVLAWLGRRQNPDAVRRRGWCVVLTLLAVVSTDAVRIAGHWTGGGTLRHLLAGLTLAGLLGLAGWSFLRAWGDVRRMLQTRWKTSLAAAVAGLILVGGLWHVTWTPRLLQQGNQDFRPSRKAPLGEVRLPDDRTVRNLPNILLISIDTLRWDMVPPRAEHLELPNFRKLRRDSLVFEKAFSTSGWTLPSHASLFGGVLPIRHGALLPHNWIYRSLPLYPQYLHKVGYRTASFTDAGYVDKVYGFCRGIDLCWEQRQPFPGYPHTGFVPGGLELTALLLNPLDRGPSLAFRPGSTVRRPYSGPQAYRHFSRNLGAARQWLRQHDHARPFFTFLHTFEAHDYGRIYPKHYRRLRNEAPELAEGVSPAGPPAVSDRALEDRANKRLYGYGIESVDESLGEFLAWLKQRHLYDETLIVFLSDHGEGFMVDHGIRGHAGHVREVLTRVPLWIKFPRNRFADRTVASFVRLSDVFPVLASYYGLEISPEPPAEEIRNRWRSTTSVAVPDWDVVPTSSAWDVPENETRPREKKQIKLGVRGSRFKLEKLRASDTGSFWTVGPDTLAQNRVAADEVPREVRQKLLTHWRQYSDLHEQFPNPYLRDNPTLTDPMIENLRGLGYMR